jgi:hypothetical protein
MCFSYSHSTWTRQSNFLVSSLMHFFINDESSEVGVSRITLINKIVITNIKSDNNQDFTSLLL